MNGVVASIHHAGTQRGGGVGDDLPVSLAAIHPPNSTHTHTAGGHSSPAARRDAHTPPTAAMPALGAGVGPAPLGTVPSRVDLRGADLPQLQEGRGELVPDEAAGVGVAVLFVSG